MSEVKVSVVLMLDTSYSMQSVIPFVIINGKAFVRQARPGDQLAVEQFNDAASMAYPTTPSFATEDPQRTVSAAAAAAIQPLAAAGNWTNIGDAVNKATGILAGATNATQAYVLLSDGQSNTGPNLTNVMITAPIYVCGLGPQMSRAYVNPLLTQNPSSQYITAQGPVQMQYVFNELRKSATRSELPSNQMDVYSGTDFATTPVTVSPTTDDVQFTVVWSRAYSYTSGTPDPTHINVTLVNPHGDTTSDQPVVADPGYAIFEPASPAPGEWTIVAQYVQPLGLNATSAGFEFDTVLNLALDVPELAKESEPTTMAAHVTHEGEAVENARVSARVMGPQFDVGRLLEKHSGVIDQRMEEAGRPDEGRASRVQELRKLLLEKAPNEEPFPYASTFRPMAQNTEGAYSTPLGATPHEGEYTIAVSARGHVPGTKAPFVRTALASVTVEK